MNFYEILGVSERASDDEIKKAYIKLCKITHPDKFKSRGEEEYQSALARFTHINQAYSVLSNPQKRLSYDEKLAKGVVSSTDELALSRQANSLFKMGKIELDKGNYAKSAQYFKAALRLFPKNLLTRAYLALAWTKDKRQNNEVMELLKKIYTQKDDLLQDEVLYITARSYTAIGEKEKAFEILKRARKVNPGNRNVQKLYERTKKEVKTGFFNFFKFKK